MGKRIYGRVVNDKNEAVEFAVVYLSDSKGKPIGNVNTQTDTKGRFVFNSLKDTDFLTSQMVGLKPTTISVKKAINIATLAGSSVLVINAAMSLIKVTSVKEAIMPLVTILVGVAAFNYAISASAAPQIVINK